MQDQLVTLLEWLHCLHYISTSHPSRMIPSWWGGVGSSLQAVTKGTQSELRGNDSFWPRLENPSPARFTIGSRWDRQPVCGFDIWHLRIPHSACLSKTTEVLVASWTGTLVRMSTLTPLVWWLNTIFRMEWNMMEPYKGFSSEDSVIGIAWAMPIASARR